MHDPRFAPLLHALQARLDQALPPRDLARFEAQAKHVTLLQAENQALRQRLEEVGARLEKLLHSLDGEAGHEG